MTEKQLREIIEKISPVDTDAIRRAAERQAMLAKPPGSLGILEDISVKLAGITAKVHNEITKTRLVVFAADNGVVEEGVSSAPQSVTLAQTINLTRGITGASSLAAHTGTEVQVVDVGVCSPVPCPAVFSRKVACGTANIAHGPAMTREQALQAMFVGIEFAEKSAADRVSLTGCGEMGIGNTTTSAAVLCSLLRKTPGEIAGKGGGITPAAYQKKLAVIQHAIIQNQPNPEDVIDVLAKVGGFDLCAMTGFFLGCAKNRLPAVVDGFISITAALCAVRLNSLVKDYIFLSHMSYEKGYLCAAEELGLTPFLNLGMRLGEGSGCPLAFQIISSACAVMNHMATFTEAEINDDYLAEIRSESCFTVEDSTC